MNGTLFLVHWHPTEADAYANVLRSEGWTVEVEAEDGTAALERIRTLRPDAVLLYLHRKPQHGRRTALHLHEHAATRPIPLLCIDGDDDTLADLRDALPHAHFVTSVELGDTLETLAHG